MPSTMPQSVREVLGEEASGDLAAWLDASIQERAVPGDEYREVLSRLDVLENDMGHVKGRLDRIDERLNQMDQRFDQMNGQFNDRFDQLQNQMRVQTRWTVGAIVAIGAILSALLSIAEFA